MSLQALQNGFNAAVRFGASNRLADQAIKMALTKGASCMHAAADKTTAAAMGKVHATQMGEISAGDKGVAKAVHMGNVAFGGNKVVLAEAAVVAADLVANQVAPGSSLASGLSKVAGPATGAATALSTLSALLSKLAGSITARHVTPLAAEKPKAD